MLYKITMKLESHKENAIVFFYYHITITSFSDKGNS